MDYPFNPNGEYSVPNYRKPNRKKHEITQEKFHEGSMIFLPTKFTIQRMGDSQESQRERALISKI